MDRLQQANNVYDKSLTMFRCALNPISRLIVDFQGRYVMQGRSCLFTIVTVGFHLNDN